MGEQKMKRIYSDVEDKLHKELMKACIDDGISMQTLIEGLARNYLKAREKQNEAIPEHSE